MFSWVRRHRRAVVAGMVLSFVTPSAYAFIDPTGVLRLAVLVRIAAIAAEINRAADTIADATRAIRARQEEMFPREALGKLGSVFQTVRGVTDELEALGQGWTLSLEADLWRRALVEEAELLRDEWEALWGRAPLSLPGRDLREYEGWASNRRYRSAASYFAAHDQWQDAASGLAAQARAGGEGQASALRSLRLTAVGTSLALQQAATANKLAAEQLDALQEDLDEERYREVLGQSLGNLFLRPMRAPSAPGPRVLFDVEGRL